MDSIETERLAHVVRELQEGDWLVDVGEEVVNGVTCKPSRVLYGPARQQLHVLGQFSARLTKGTRSTDGPIYVVRGLNLLSLQMLTALQLVRRVNTNESFGEQDVKNQFPKVFQGLGVLGEEYRIKLEENATPYALHVLRNIPIPLRPQVKEELDRMENLGIISRVEKPTSWCAGMVVVPKKSGDVRICVDLKPLNNHVLREPYPIPAVDDTLAFLSGAVRFSKLDANSGFWQVPLAEESRPLTTFITPFGRYQFNKLPSGTVPVPDERHLGWSRRIRLFDRRRPRFWKESRRARYAFKSRSPTIGRSKSHTKRIKV